MSRWDKEVVGQRTVTREVREMLAPTCLKREGKRTTRNSGTALPLLPPHVRTPLPALNPASTWYLFGPELQCLLPGFFKVFLLADVGLRSRSREGPSAQRHKEEWGGTAAALGKCCLQHPSKGGTFHLRGQGHSKKEKGTEQGLEKLDCF